MGMAADARASSPAHGNGARRRDLADWYDRPRVQVALFISCLTDTFHPRAGVAVVRLLEHLGHEVAFPLGQTCCGQPLFNNGFRREARAVALRTMGLLEPYLHVVTPSASCAAMIREQYAHLFDPGSGPHGRAVALAGRTFEIVEFLIKVLGFDPARHGAAWQGTATWHRSCHLHALGMKDEAVDLLRRIDRLEFVPLPDAGECCGFGGTFAVKYPTISGGMVQEKVRAIMETAASTVVCGEAGCTMNMAGACRRRGHRVAFRTPVEVLAESLGLLEPDAPT